MLEVVVTDPTCLKPSPSGGTLLNCFLSFSHGDPVLFLASSECKTKSLASKVLGVWHMRGGGEG